MLPHIFVFILLAPKFMCISRAHVKDSQKGMCHLPRKALEGRRVSLCQPGIEDAADSAESLTKPPCCHLSSCSSQRWNKDLSLSRLQAFNIWGLEKSSHDHKSHKGQMSQRSVAAHIRGRSRSCPERRGLSCTLSCINQN